MIEKYESSGYEFKPYLVLVLRLNLQSRVFKLSFTINIKPRKKACFRRLSTFLPVFFFHASRHAAPISSKGFIKNSGICVGTVSQKIRHAQCPSHLLLLDYQLRRIVGVLGTFPGLGDQRKLRATCWAGQPGYRVLRWALFLGWAVKNSS